LLVAALASALASSVQVAGASELAGYEIGIAGQRFDPKQAGLGPNAQPRMTSAELDRHKRQPSYYLIQLHSPPDPAVSAHLKERYGAKLEEYVPNLSYVEKLEPSAVTAAAVDPHIRAVVPFQPSFKLSPAIGTLVPRTPERKGVQGLLLRALLFFDVDPQTVALDITALGATEIKILDERQHKGGVARLQFVLPSTDQLAALARIDGLRWIEEVGEIITDNSWAAGTVQSGSSATPGIWLRNLHGEGQIIGIIDELVPDINHCFFRDPANNLPGAGHRKVVQLRSFSDFAGQHATFVAGNAAGDDFNTPGIHVHRGGAWASRLAAANFNDIRVGRTSMREELEAAARAGAAIHTNSWHYNGPKLQHSSVPLYNQIAADVDSFTWYDEDRLVLGSAGNRGEEQGPPGSAKNAVAVGASKADPDQMEFGDGNPGPTSDGRRKPDLMAPGCRIGSAIVRTTCDTGPLPNAAPCGSSFATPHAAGAAALVRQYFIEGWYPSGLRRSQDAQTPSGALLKAMLINSTLDMTGIAGYPSDAEGWGIIRLDKVMYFEGGPRKIQVWDVRNAAGLATTGATGEHTVTVVDSTTPLKVVLVWTEPPGTAGASNPVINNLDLLVISPDGAQLFLGNVFGTSGVSVTGGTADAANNVEVVLIAAPATGQWKLRVQGTLVARGNPGQGYALVASGGLTPPPPAPAASVTAR